MSQNTSEIYETKGVVNVSFVIDRHGHGWYCSEPTTGDPSLSNVCESEDSVLYDRGFGG